MLNFLSWVLLIIYLTASAGLLVYGLNCYIMLFIFLRKKDEYVKKEKCFLEEYYRDGIPNDLPKVTTQIPLFNEYNVAVRVIRAVAAMDYPEGKHQIQVLDDSTDETTEIVDQEVEALRQSGIDISVVRRQGREGFKAGALSNGLKTVSGELVAIFDADFIPEKDFLLKTVPFFIKDENLGILQTRWGHVNRKESLLTRLQALGIDGHFMVEQPARAWNNLFMNFNGTAGMFRKQSIFDAGGWQADTLTEDMDLSYRIQLKGWNVHYSLTTIVPSELPENIHAFKNQQFRWAKGSIQTACKLLGRVMRSDRKVFAKAQALLHLSHYCVHPLMLTLSILALPVLMTFPIKLSPLIFGFCAFFLLIAMTGPSALYTGSQAVSGKGWIGRIAFLPFLVCMGVGLAFSNSRAVIEAFMGKKSPFVRTPKKGDKEVLNYNRAVSCDMFFELGLGIYCVLSFVMYIVAQKYLIGPFLFIYSCGFVSVSLFGFLHARKSGVFPYRIFMAVTSALLVVLITFKLGRIGYIGANFFSFLILYGLMVVTAFLFFITLPKGGKRIKVELSIFIVALLCRAAVFPLLPSDDINRYMWEGKMLNQNVNPYELAPDSSKLVGLRDNVWKGINHPDMPAAYPPGILFLFSQLNKISYDQNLYKAVFCLFDLATLIIIFAFLRLKEREVRFSILYALNPVVIISFAGQGHYDSVMVSFMCASLLAWYYRKWVIMFMALLLAVQSKQVSLLLLPFLINRSSMKYLWIFLIGVSVPYIPFVFNDLSVPFSSLFVFGSEMAHNGSIHGILRVISGSTSFATGMCACIFLLVCIYIFKAARKDVFKSVFLVMTFLLLLSPTVHFWYLVWFIPLLCIYPRWSWSLLCLTISLYFISDKMFLENGVWDQPVLFQFILWAPVYLILFYELVIFFKRRKKSFETNELKTVSIIIPTLNAEKFIKGCLENIKSLNPLPLEVIVVDGGSIDATLDIVSLYDVKLVKSPPGRGNQIKQALQNVSGDVTAVLHSDTRLAVGALGKMLESLNGSSGAIGGALGQHFMDNRFGLTLIEILNDMRAGLLGISFGDQVQFFRTNAAKKYSLVPEIPLMEDVELSIRLLGAGKTVFLWGGVVVDNYKWNSGSFIRFIKVMYLLILFMLRRFRHSVETKDLYQMYYKDAIETNEK